MTSLSGVHVGPHPTNGMALYASRPYEAGDHILTAPPLMCRPLQNNIERVCAHCLTVGEPRGCSRCHRVFYCDAACQRAAWKTHGKECKALSNLTKGLEPPTIVRSVMQALLVKDIGDRVMELEGNLNIWQEDTEWATFQLVAAGAVTYAGLAMTMANLTRASDLLFKIQTNCFQREDELVGQVGIFLEPTIARANHSCVPNAFVHFSNRTVVLRAEASIQLGEEIQISYSDCTHPLFIRRKALKGYKFECQCPRCKHDLNVYQVCCHSSNVALNWHSLVSDISQLQEHPAIDDEHKISIARQYGEIGADLADYPEIPQNPDELHQFLLEGFKRCKPLADEELWAVSPMPQLLNEVTIHYNTTGKYPQGLFVACFIATSCDPYRFPAPFVSVRSARLFELAKSMLNIASDINLLMSPIKQLAIEGGHKGDLGRYLGDIDLVSLAHMILIMLLGDLHGGVTLEEQNTEESKQMLRDIDETPGREEEKSIIKLWRTDPTSNMSRAMFDFTVVKQVEALGRLGRAVIRRDFKV